MEILWLLSGRDKAYLVPEGMTLFSAPEQLQACAGEWIKAVPDINALLQLLKQCQGVVLVADQWLFAESVLENLPADLPKLVMLTAKTSTALREQLAKLEVDAYITESMSQADLNSVIKKRVQDKMALVAMQQELKNFSSIAFTAMSSASEMGIVALFAEKAQTTMDFAHLARATLACVKDLGLSAVLQFAFESDIKLYPENASAAYKRLLSDALQSGNRIVSMGRFLLFNFAQVQLLITDAPCADVERYGRLRDVLAHLVSIAEARARTLKVNAMLKAQQENTRLVMTLLEMASRDNRNSVKEIMTDLSVSLRTMAMGMDLTLEQESELLGLAEKALNSLEGLQVATLAVEEHFRSLLEQLDDVASLLDRGMEEEQSAESESSNVELF